MNKYEKRAQAERKSIRAFVHDVGRRGVGPDCCGDFDSVAEFVSASGYFSKVAIGAGGPALSGAFSWSPLAQRTATRSAT